MILLLAIPLAVIASAYDLAYLAPSALIGIGLWCVGEQIWRVIKCS